MADSGTLSDCILTACLWEVTAIKAGNVHPQAALGAMRYSDFVRSAEVIAPILANARSLSVGRAILEAVTATQAAVGCNTNLGIILLIAPLAAVPARQALADGIGTVLDSITVAETSLVYEAIRLANPGGLGDAAKQDVKASPTLALKSAMALAADRDQIAREYSTNFQWLLTDAVPQFLRELAAVPREVVQNRYLSAVASLQIWMLALKPDTLILRKSGPLAAAAVQQHAQEIQSIGGLHSIQGRKRFLDLDQWMRGAASQRNPGTTADLIAATLFAAFREGCVPLDPVMSPSICTVTSISTLVD